jgi:hypothetical protein
MVSPQDAHLLQDVGWGVARISATNPRKEARAIGDGPGVRKGQALHRVVRLPSDRGTRAERGKRAKRVVARDGNCLHATRSNLEPSSHQAIAVKLKRRGTSGFVGVKASRRSQYTVHDKAGRPRTIPVLKRYTAKAGDLKLGKWATGEEAAIAYDTAVLGLFGKNAVTNAKLRLLPREFAGSEAGKAAVEFAKKAVEAHRDRLQVEKLMEAQRLTPEYLMDKRLGLVKW